MLWSRFYAGKIGYGGALRGVLEELKELRRAGVGGAENWCAVHFCGRCPGFIPAMVSLRRCCREPTIDRRVIVCEAELPLEQWLRECGRLTRHGFSGSGTSG